MYGLFYWFNFELFLYDSFLILTNLILPLFFSGASFPCHLFYSFGSHRLATINMFKHTYWSGFTTILVTSCVILIAWCSLRFFDNLSSISSSMLPLLFMISRRYLNLLTCSIYFPSFVVLCFSFSSSTIVVFVFSVLHSLFSLFRYFDVGSVLCSQTLPFHLHSLVQELELLRSPHDIKQQGSNHRAMFDSTITCKVAWLFFHHSYVINCLFMDPRITIIFIYNL